MLTPEEFKTAVKKVAHLINKKGLAQRDVERLSGKYVVSTLMRGRSNEQQNIALLGKIAQVFDTPIDQFFVKHRIPQVRLKTKIPILRWDEIKPYIAAPENIERQLQWIKLKAFVPASSFATLYDPDSGIDQTDSFKKDDLLKIFPKKAYKDGDLVLFSGYRSTLTIGKFDEKQLADKVVYGAVCKENN